MFLRNNLSGEISIFCTFTSSGITNISVNPYMYEAEREGELSYMRVDSTTFTGRNPSDMKMPQCPSEKIQWISDFGS